MGIGRMKENTVSPGFLDCLPLYNKRCGYEN